jgi:hypothetical protein
MAGHVESVAELRKLYSTHILVGKRERMRPLGRHRHRWENNIRMDLREMVGKVWTGAI